MPIMKSQGMLTIAISQTLDCSFQKIWMDSIGSLRFTSKRILGRTETEESSDANTTNEIKSLKRLGTCLTIWEFTPEKSPSYANIVETDLHRTETWLSTWSFMKKERYMNATFEVKLIQKSLILEFILSTSITRYPHPRYLLLSLKHLNRCLWYCVSYV